VPSSCLTGSCSSIVAPFCSLLWNELSTTALTCEEKWTTGTKRWTKSVANLPTHRLHFAVSTCTTRSRTGVTPARRTCTRAPR
jgi:hypothetical protein